MSEEKIMPPVHPGEILKEEFLAPLGMSPGKLAILMGVPNQRMYDVVGGKRSITLDTALRLAKVFGTSYQLWLSLQTEYDYQCAEDAGLIERIERAVRPQAFDSQRAVHA